MGNACTGSPKKGSGGDLGNTSASSVLGKTHDPAFQWKICGFSALLEKGTIPAYSDMFHCSGYQWYLKLSPMLHKQSGGGIPYVALSLCLNTGTIKAGYTVKAVFEISIYNHSIGAYCGYKGSYSFEMKKMISGRMWLIPLEELMKSSDFLVDDSCVFGLRVRKVGVSSPPKKKNHVAPEKPIAVQNLFLHKKGFLKGTYTWTMNSFPSLKPQPVFSPAFEVVGHKWCITVYPLGNALSTESLSMYLHMYGSNELPPDSGVMIELTVSILNQGQGKQHFSQRARLPFGGEKAWEWSDFIPLKTLKNPSNGYLVGSKCVVKADIAIIGSTKKQ